MPRRNEHLPTLVTIEQAESDLNIRNASARIRAWQRDGKLDSAGTYYPPKGKGVDLFNTDKLMALVHP
jgi:hypothetical protein